MPLRLAVDRGACPVGVCPDGRAAAHAICSPLRLAVRLCVPAVGICPLAHMVEPQRALWGVPTLWGCHIHYSPKVLLLLQPQQEIVPHLLIP